VPEAVDDDEGLLGQGESLLGDTVAAIKTSWFSATVFGLCIGGLMALVLIHDAPSE
jgi:hypothetical protein